MLHISFSEILYRYTRFYTVQKNISILKTAHFQCFKIPKRLRTWIICSASITQCFQDIISRINVDIIFGKDEKFDLKYGIFLRFQRLANLIKSYLQKYKHQNVVSIGST